MFIIIVITMITITITIVKGFDDGKTFAELWEDLRKTLSEIFTEDPEAREQERKRKTHKIHKLNHNNNKIITQNNKNRTNNKYTTTS